MRITFLEDNVKVDSGDSPLVMDTSKITTNTYNTGYYIDILEGDRIEILNLKGRQLLDPSISLYIITVVLYNEKGYATDYLFMISKFKLDY